jgi:hypothetical protein
MNKRIIEEIKKLSPEKLEDHDNCIKKGYKDEICPKCNTIFLANVHFVRCDEKPCPMSNGKSLLDMILEQIDSPTLEEDFQI